MAAGAKLLAAGVRLLARREHSRAELRAKLARAAGATAAELDAALARLSELGYLSDRRFAEQFVASRRRRWGRRRIELELRRRGVDQQLAAAALDSGLGGDEAQRALEVLRKKSPAPLVAGTKLELRCRRFLAARGFGADAIRAALGAHRA